MCELSIHYTTNKYLGVNNLFKVLFIINYKLSIKILKKMACLLYNVRRCINFTTFLVKEKRTVHLLHSPYRNGKEEKAMKLRTKHSNCRFNLSNAFNPIF